MEVEVSALRYVIFMCNKEVLFSFWVYLETCTFFSYIEVAKVMKEKG